MTKKKNIKLSYGKKNLEKNHEAIKSGFKTQFFSTVNL